MFYRVIAEWVDRTDGYAILNGLDQRNITFAMDEHRMHTVFIRPNLFFCPSSSWVRQGR